MTNKDKYRKYCHGHHLALYQNDWWLDAVCGDNWDAVVTKTGAFAFPYKKKYGLKLIQMPMLTLGLAPIGNIDWKSLPSNDLMDIYLLPGISAPVLQGAKLITRHTHRLNDISNTEKVFSKFSSSTRQQIRKAAKNIQISAGGDVDTLYKMVSFTFKRQDKKVPYTKTYVQSIVEACRKHTCCDILVARDADKNVHGACLLAWDDETAFYVMGGSDPKYRSSAAYSLLMWDAIRLASSKSAAFDFCGSSIASVAKFFKGFGAAETPYLHIKRVNSKALKLALAIKGK